MLQRLQEQFEMQQRRRAYLDVVEQRTISHINVHPDADLLNNFLCSHMQLFSAIRKKLKLSSL